MAHEVDVDGEGRFGIHGLPIAYPPTELEPLDDDKKPEAGSWGEIKKSVGWTPGVTTARPSRIKSPAG
jgi:hypothetical protein